VCTPQSTSEHAVFPPPPMARLQPMPASHELLSPFDDVIRALRPNWANAQAELRNDIQRLGWKILEENAGGMHEGIWQKLEGTMRGHSDIVDPMDSELPKGIFDELPPWKVCVPRISEGGSMHFQVVDALPPCFEEARQCEM
jgi:hypothetical protein